ncbi:hypothetical protein R6Q59_017873 [Mikania micrantha]
MMLNHHHRGDEGEVHQLENGKASGGGGGGYTEDGTVDLRGNPILRSKRGRWTACSFIVVYEVFERMAYYGISSNLIIYLTTKLRQGTVRSSNNVTNWVGTIWMTPILGAYVADALLGRYWTFIISAAIYLSGMSLLTLAVSLPGLKPPGCDSGINCKKASTIQLAVFFGALTHLRLERVAPSLTSRPSVRTNLTTLNRKRRPKSSPFQLVDVQHLLWYPVRQHSSRVHTGQCGMDPGLRPPHTRPPYIHHHLLGWNTFLQAQSSNRQPLH